MIVNVVFGIGSNVGDRQGNISNAVREICLSSGYDFIALSSVYETEPWGFKKQGKFLNCVLVCLCRDNPGNVLKHIKSIEGKIGRVSRKKWHEREIDIDILFYNEKIFSSRGLKIPHPQIAFRNFVLQPLAELMPGYIHPVLNKSIRMLCRNSKDKSGVTLYKLQG